MGRNDGEHYRYPSEDAIISELKNEKLRFEQNIKSLIDGNSHMFIPNDSEPSLSSVTLANEEVARFNSELQSAF